MRKRQNRRRRVATVILKRRILRRLRWVGFLVADLPNSPLYKQVQQRRDIDEIRAYYPLYKTPPSGRRSSGPYR
ncbi:MAG TPA: hypothetical protein VHL09_08820 [Dehalococcoidia bacterium]|nr:hypothetical protein [Dehalococcoidia bacterium]